MLLISEALTNFGKEHDWKQMVKIPMKEKVSYFMAWAWFRCQFCLISLWDFCLPRGDDIYLRLCLINYWHFSLLVCFSWWGIILHFEWYHPMILGFTVPQTSKTGEEKLWVSSYKQLLNTASPTSSPPPPAQYKLLEIKGELYQWKRKIHRKIKHWSQWTMNLVSKLFCIKSGKSRIRKKSQKYMSNIHKILTLKNTSVPFLNTDEGWTWKKKKKKVQ